MSTVAHWNLAPASRKRNGQRTTSGASAVESTMCRLGIPFRDGDRSDQMVSDRSSRVAGYVHRGGGEGAGRRVGDRTVSAERSPGARWWTISSTVMVAMGSSCRT